jgi:outer membrane immunogenic protein
MNKVLTAAAFAALMSTTAYAADLPSRRAPPVFAPPPAIPVFTWSGAYAGINAGYAFDGNSYNNLAASTAGQQAAINVGDRAAFLRQRSSGFTGGGQIGYNYELGGGLPILGALGNGGAQGGVVIGVEADASYTDLRNSVGYIGTLGGASQYNADTQFVGTVRGRLGYAFGNFLVYGTGGFAYGSVNDAVAFAPGAAGYFGQTSSLRTGYAYGGGLEYAIPTTSFVNFFNSSAVTIKAEFIHYDLGTQSLVLNSSAGGLPYVDRIKTSGNLVRAGLNYKINLFNAPAAPVVARY